MRLRYWTGLLAVGGIVFFLSMQGDKRLRDEATMSESASVHPEGVNSSARTSLDDDDLTNRSTAASADRPSLMDDAVTWTRVVGTGDSLSGLLAEAGLDSRARTEVARAIASEYDLRQLKPGHRLAVSMAPDGVARTATLEIDNGTRIFATLGAETSVQRLAPDLESVRHAGEVKIKSSIYAALDHAGIPTRFATDLELILAGAFDLRTALGGGENIRLTWREFHSGNRVVGEPMIDFAQLDLVDGRYEILWPDDSSRRTMIFKDGHLLQTFDQPIRGARLSSAFGPRMHPVHGIMRMHSGVDFAADQGAVVAATEAGKITFLGKRSGYGLLVEIEHKGGIRTIYAHLSALNDALETGQRVAAGSEIGKVGSTGTSTAPHLHYEIQIDGRPVSPLADTQLRGPADDAPRAIEAYGLVNNMQSAVDRLLASGG